MEVTHDKGKNDLYKRFQVGYHLNKMEEKGVVRKKLEGRIIRYFPLGNSDA